MLAAPYPLLADCAAWRLYAEQREHPVRADAPIVEAETGQARASDKKKLIRKSINRDYRKCVMECHHSSPGSRRRGVQPDAQQRSSTRSKGRDPRDSGDYAAVGW